MTKGRKKRLIEVLVVVALIAISFFYLKPYVFDAWFGFKWLLFLFSIAIILVLFKVYRYIMGNK